MTSQPFIRYQLIFETDLKRNRFYHGNIKECFHITDILRILCYFFSQLKYYYCLFFFHTTIFETFVKEKQAKSVIANTPSDISSVKRTRLQIKKFLVTIKEWSWPTFCLGIKVLITWFNSCFISGILISDEKVESSRSTQLSSHCWIGSKIWNLNLSSI